MCLGKEIAEMKVPMRQVPVEYKGTKFLQYFTFVSVPTTLFMYEYVYKKECRS